MISSNAFEYFILSIILINMVVFMSYTHRQDSSKEETFAVINYIIMGIFIVECILKLTCLGCRYFLDSWNVFDFLLICISIFSTTLEQM